MPFDVVVPALTLRAAGVVDLAATRRYAERASATWVDYFILSGSTTEGDQLSSVERAEILDLWLSVAAPEKLLACCWEPTDFQSAADRQITPMGVLRAGTHAEAVDYLGGLPAGATIYSHPMFGGVVFDRELATLAAEQDALPAGAKLAKITGDRIKDLRSVVGPDFRLWDGSSRRIAAALENGASGVVATPLTLFSSGFPEKDVDTVQAAVDVVQDMLDALPDRAARTRALQSAVES